MRPGLFPSQQRALQRAFKKADAFDHFRQRTRRAFVGAVLGGLSVSVGTYFLGRGLQSRDPSATGTVTESTPQSFDAVALGPIEKLEAQALNVLAEIEMGRATPALWIGVERLALRAVVEANREPLRARLIATRSAVQIPAGLESAFARLVAVARGR